MSLMALSFGNFRQVSGGDLDTLADVRVNQPTLPMG